MSAPESRAEAVAWCAATIHADVNRTALAAVLAGVPADDVRADLQRMLLARPRDGDYFRRHSYEPVLSWLTGAAL